MKVQVSDGIHVAVESLGEGTPPLMLLHGRTSNASTFEPCRKDLARRRRIWTMDLRGHGDSDAPKEEEAYSMERWVEDLAEVVTALDLPPFVLLGHSMGGFVALRYALRKDHRLLGLIMEDSGPGRLEEGEGAPARPWGDDEIRMAEEEGMEALVAHFGGDALDASKRRRLLSHAPWSYAHAIRVCRSTPSVAHRLAEISVPTLILCGERDPAFLEASRLMEQRIPDGQTVVLNGAGHSPHREATAPFLSAIEDFFIRLDGR